MMSADQLAGHPTWRGRLLVVLLVTTVAAMGCGHSSTRGGAAVTSPQQTKAPLVTGRAPEPSAAASAAPTTPGRLPIPAPTTPGRVPTADPATPDRPADVSSGAPPRPVPHRSSGTAVLSAAAPVRLLIPAIDVDSTLMDLGLESDGALEVPPEGFPAGWYRGSPTPGELGPAIIAGHVDWAGQPGVFFELRDLAAGDGITITRRDGDTARFRVTHVERYDKDAFPTQAVYGDLDHAGLRLITCGGSFDARAGSYRDNVVVFAELSGSTG